MTAKIIPFPVIPRLRPTVIDLPGDGQITVTEILAEIDRMLASAQTTEPWGGPMKPLETKKS